MISIGNVVRNVFVIVNHMRQLAGYSLRFLCALMCPKTVPATRLLAAESQLAVCTDRITSYGTKRLGQNRACALLTPNRRAAVEEKSDVH